MTDADFEALWDEFLEAWPADRVRQMTLEDYTNPAKDDAFIYWIEKRLDKLGSIWGGSAFKFGIYCRSDTEAKEARAGRTWGDKYAWLTKYGNDEQSVFVQVRARIFEVVEAAQAGKLERIERVDLGRAIKWKIAFHYQDRAKPTILPVFNKEMLFFAYKAINPGAVYGKTPMHLMYTALLGQRNDNASLFDRGRAIWEAWAREKAKAVRAWAVPLGDLTVAERGVLLAKTAITQEEITPGLETRLAEVDMAVGDRIALLDGHTVRAVGTVQNAEPGERAWNQTIVDLPSGLASPPALEVVELSAVEWRDIQERLPKAAAPAGIHFWKIAPGANAVGWPDWQRLGIASIGWEELGDLAGISRAEFDERATRCKNEHQYSGGETQAWTFHDIQVGDRVVANKGTGLVLGIGTVVGGYHFSPSAHVVNGEDFAHQIDVHWDDTTPHEVHENGWRRTLVELDREAFERLLGTPKATVAPTPAVVAPAPKPPGPCAPKNIILYGPPGTGKTYSTVMRALQLILGAEKVAGLSEFALTALFRDHQARGQIEFVTFHQSYGYEEFVEGLRPVLGAGESKDVRYELHDGIFKRIAMRAAADGLVRTVEPVVKLLQQLQTARPVPAPVPAQPVTTAHVQEALDQAESGGASFSFTDQTRQYVLIIDEVNRGNISRILGELITLLEPDKRLGAPTELKLPLSYSPGHKFAVPPNLHVLATMNTADRSIALMDVALRRRFTFEELMPNVGVIRDVLSKHGVEAKVVDLTAELFETLNARIRFLYDRDHQLGHAFFLGVRTLDDLRQVLVDRVIPLLQEYFYGAWDKICTVLGCPYDSGGQPRRKGDVVQRVGSRNAYVAPLIDATAFAEEATIGFDHEEYEDRYDFALSPAFGAGTLLNFELARTLLCVLNLDPGKLGGRLAAWGAARELGADDESTATAAAKSIA